MTPPQNILVFKYPSRDRVNYSLDNTQNTLPQVTILRKIRGNSQESFTEKSGEILVSRSEEFLVTNSEEFLITLSKECLVTNSKEFLVTNSVEKLEKMSTKFVKILGRFQRKVLQNQFLGISWKLIPRISQEFLRKILKYSQHIPE